VFLLVALYLVLTGPEHLGQFQLGNKKLTKWDWLNWLHKRVENLIYIEAHTNAADNDGWYDAKGPRIFIGKNASLTTSKLAAQFTFNLPDGYKAHIKRSSMYILTRTTCPAILIELMFHTNLQEVKEARGQFGHIKYVRGLYDGILGFEKGGV
jgi:N-acetylmuramoyl-L-alanine amidase